MARITFKSGDEYALKLSRLATSGQEAIAKKAIYAGAKIVADKIRSNLEAVVSKKASGELAGSFGIASIDRDSNGNYNTKLGFDGYDERGVPNQLKARVLESGTSDERQKKRPFVRPAVNATKNAAKEAMAKVIDEETKKFMK
jgi:HK97 gp10 family phage protein